jgi:hypothetical protein
MEPSMQPLQNLGMPALMSVAAAVRSLGMATPSPVAQDAPARQHMAVLPVVANVPAVLA